MATLLQTLTDTKYHVLRNTLSCTVMHIGFNIRALYTGPLQYSAIKVDAQRSRSPAVDRKYSTYQSALWEAHMSLGSPRPKIRN